MWINPYLQETLTREYMADVERYVARRAMLQPLTPSRPWRLGALVAWLRRAPAWRPRRAVEGMATR